MTYDVDAGDRVHGQSELRTVDDAAMVAVAMANDLKHGVWVHSRGLAGRRPSRRARTEHTTRHCHADCAREPSTTAYD